MFNTSQLPSEKIPLTSGRNNKSFRKPIASDESDSSRIVGGAYSSTSNGDPASGLREWASSSMQFSEIRSLRRIQRTEGATGTDDVIGVPGIVHPVTGDVLTVGEAISLRILDVRTGKIVISPDNSVPAVSIAEAASKRLVDAELAERLLKPCGITSSNGRELSLLEAIQRELCDAERGFFTGEVTYEELPGEPGISIAGRQEAKQSRGLSLTDALAQGLVDDRSGRVLDRNTGIKYPLTDAVAKGIIDPYVREIVDTISDNKLTVKQAMDVGVLDSRQGKYIHGLSQEILPLREARRRQLIIKPMTLKDVCDNELMDSAGHIFSPTHKEKISINECIVRGVLDSDNITCVSNTSSKELLTLSEALREGIVTSDGKFHDIAGNQYCTVPEAVDRGLITSVAIKSIFDIDGFKDIESKEFVSLNVALAKYILAIKSGCILFVSDSKSNKTISLNQALQDNLVRPEVLEMLNRPIGIFEKSKELSVVEAVARGYINPKYGQVMDLKTHKPIPLDDAIRKKIITSEGAALLSSLLAISVTTQTVTKTVKRYVTVTSSGITTSEVTMSYGEALKQGFIDEKNQTFLDPHTGRILTLQEAEEVGYLTSTVGEHHSNVKNPPAAIIDKNVSIKPTSTIIQVSNNTGVFKGDTIDKGLITIKTSHDPIAQHPSTENMETCTRTITDVEPHITEHINPAENKEFFFKENEHTVLSHFDRLSSLDKHKDNIDLINAERQSASMEKQIFELPPDGWFLSEAIDQRLFDPVTGLFIIPGTDRLVSFEECVKLEIINPSSAYVIDPNNSRKLSMMRSLEKRVLDVTGHYVHGGKKLTMKEAIDKGFVIIERRSCTDSSSPRLIQITKVTGKPDIVEVSDVVNGTEPPNFKEIRSSDANICALEPLQVSEGIIYDPSTALVIFTNSGRSDSLLASVKEGKIEPRMVKVKDPYSGKELNINEAIRKGIVDRETGDYKDKSGRKIPFIEAAKFGVISVLGAPILAVKKAIKFVDPKTGEEIAVETAIERGLISNDTLPDCNTENLNSEHVVTTKTEIISTSVIVQDPVTGFEISAEEAVEKGIISPEDLRNISSQKTVPTKVLGTTSISLDDDGPSAGELTRGRVTTEPKYKVAIGRARSFSQSPEREAKPVVLQKMRKKVIRPKDAVDSGLIDKETAEVLEKPETFIGNEGESLSLAEAVCSKRLDGNAGAILDPQRGDVLTVREAMERGILDPSGQIGRLLYPIVRSLSIPELVIQGLIDSRSHKIVHPETGAHLSLKEAIVCEVVDPLSKINEFGTKNKITLEDAIAKGNIDDEKMLINNTDGAIDLITASQDSKIFPPTDPIKIPGIQELPPAGMTFPVALRRGLVDPVKKEIRHPITGDRRPVETAIKQDFIMALPYPVSPYSIEVTQALDRNLIDSEKGTFKNPKTGQDIPISEAVESGLLIIKPVPHTITYEPSGTVTAVTETVTSYHTITTKTIELLQGYILVGPNEVKNSHTGEIISLQEAKQRGIVKDESETKQEFTTREIKMSFNDAIAQGLIDLDAGTYTTPDSGVTMTITDAIKEGLLETEHQVDTSRLPAKNQQYNIVEAFNELYDPKIERFRDPKLPNVNYTFEEALDKGIIDRNSVVYDVVNAKSVTTQEAVEQGLIDPQTGFVKDVVSGRQLNVREAAKIGILAVLGAPLLAGLGVAKAVQSIKANVDKKINSQSSEKVDGLNKLEKQYLDRKLGKAESQPIDSKLPVKEICSPVITIKTQSRSNSQTDKSSLKTVPLKKAIEDNLIDPAACTITIFTNDGRKTVPLSEGLKHVSLDDEVEVHSKNSIGLVDQKTRFKVKISKQLNPLQMSDKGIYDMSANNFIDPRTGENINFADLVFIHNVFDPNLVLVKDLNSKPENYITLKQALDCGLVNKFNGQMIDPNTKKIITLFEAAKLGWITESVPSVNREYNKKSKPFLTLQEAVNEGLYDLTTGDIQDPQSGQHFKFLDAINKGILDPQSISIRNPENDDIIPFSEAVEIGMVDLNRGVIINVETRKEVEFKVALLKGYMVAATKKPMSLEAVIKKGLYNSQNGKIIDPLTKQNIDIEEAVKRCVVDAFITECKDAASDSFVSLDDALSNNLVNPATGKLHDTLTGTLLPLNIALQKGLIITNQICVSLIDAITQEYYCPQTGKFYNPIIGEEVSLQDGIDSGFIDSLTVRVKDLRCDKIVTIKDAALSGLLDVHKGLLMYPSIMTLDVAYEKGYLLTTRKPLALQEALSQGCYDPETGLMVMNGEGERMTLEEAIRRGEISRDTLAVKDPRSGDIITLGEAIKIGVIDPKSGTAVDPTNGAEMHFYDALERGLVIPAKRKFSLPEAVFKGFYDPKSGKFTSPGTKEKLPTDRAIRKGLIDSASTLVKTGDGKIITFCTAVEEGIIDARTGTIRGTDKLGSKLDFQEAFDQGLLIEVRRPMTLSEALVKSVFNEEKGLFLDPSSGEYVTLSYALENNLIDSDSVHVKDTRSGFWKKLSLAEAIKLGFVNGATARVKDFTKGNAEVSITEAFETGLIVDSKAAVSIQRAIHQGLYDDKSGKLTDPNTGRKITLHEAIRRFIINPLLPCYWDKKSERLLSLVETCRNGIIDRRAGLFKEPGANCTVSLSEAMDLGLIVDIESAGFGLYEAIAMGLYDAQTLRFVHPSTGRKLRLNDACKEELINPLSSIVKHVKTGKYMKLTEAIEIGIIDDEKGIYKFPDSQKFLTLTDAKAKGLIVTCRKPLSIAEAVRSGLYRPETGRFIDPDVGDHLDLAQALVHGLIDANTTALKDPVSGHLKSVNSGIEDGTVDVSHGRVIDGKTKRSYTIDSALDRELLVSVDRPITFQQAVRRGSIDFQRGTFKDPRTMQECTLEDAIKFELIDPESAVVKDPQTGRFRTLKKAITDGVIDLNKRAAFDPQTGKVKPLCIIFEQGTVVFLREPLTFDTAVELGHLNISTGKFTDPQSKESLTLKDAISLGLIDPDSVLVKDTLKKKLVKLPEAFRKGLMDSEKGNVVDSESSRLYSLQAALESDLLTTPRHGLSLIESIQFGLYNPTTGGFRDPFSSSGIIDRRRLTLEEAIESGVIDPSTTVVKDAASGNISSLPDAISDTKLVDAVAGRLLETSTGKTIDLSKALDRGYILAAQARVSHFYYFFSKCFFEINFSMCATIIFYELSCADF